MTTLQETTANKIKKLLRLSKSSNEHEAALALQKAHNILAQSGMSMTDVEVATAEVKETIKKTGYKRMPLWVATLGHVIAGHTYTKMLTTNANIYFIGDAVDCEVASYMFDYLYKTVKGMSKEYTKQFYNKIPLHRTITLSYSYALGVVRTIKDKVDAMKPAEVEKTVTGTELVVVKQAAINGYLEQKYPKLEVRKRQASNLSGQAFLAGMVDGKDVSVHTGIKNTENIKQLQ